MKWVTLMNIEGIVMKMEDLQQKNLYLPTIQH